MKRDANPRFWRCYRGLPKEIRQLADRSYELLKADPTHGSLHFKKVGQFWSARVGLHYRALAVEADSDFLCVLCVEDQWLKQILNTPPGLRPGGPEGPPYERGMVILPVACCPLPALPGVLPTADCRP